MRAFRSLAALLGCAAFALSGAAAAEMVVVKLQSYEEVPAVSSAATGHFNAFIDDRAGTIDYELSYSGLEGDVRQSHIHFGQRGVAGGISVFLCQTTFNPDPTGHAPTCPQSGTVTGTITAANIIGPAGQGIAATELDELIAAIRAGIAYPNVHSTKFPAGEIRGQFH
jgi:CHRD domain-containing protein